MITTASQPATSDRVLPRLQFHIVFTERVPRSDDPFEDLGDLLPAHLDWVAEQEEAGHLFMAGPFRSDTFWEGDGMMIFKTATIEQTEAIARTCPLHVVGLRRFRVVPWQFNEGSLTLTLRQSGGQIRWG